MIFVIEDGIVRVVGQNKYNTRDLSDKTKSPNEDKIEDMEDWLDEHGHPSFEYLKSLANNNNMEKLRSIAEDLDVEYSPGASAEDLIGAIRSATGNDPNTTT